MKILKAVERAPRGRGISNPNRIHAAAAGVERSMAAVYRDAVAQWIQWTPRERLADAIRTERWETVLGAFNWPLLGGGLQEMLTPIGEAIAQVEAQEAKQIARAVGRPIVVKQEVTGTASLDLANPWAVTAANRQAARLVQGVTLEVQRAIRAIIAQAVAQGLSPRDQAEAIADILRQAGGLTQRQATALMNYRAKLVEQQTAPSRIEQLVAQQADRYIEQRALTISRHESMQAANAGQDAIWRSAADHGLIPPDQKRKWITAKGPRVCKICRPMDGQVQPIGKPFVSSFDGSQALHPPIHVQCRCTIVLAFD